MIKLYDFPLSGHAHRARLMLSLLNLEHEIVHVKLDEGEHLEKTYTDINPFQQVPVLDDNGFVVRDSIAILCYLASQYDDKWYPKDAQSIARIQEWLVVASKEMATGPAAARLVTVFGMDLDQDKAIADSHKLLKIMDVHLEGRQWLALDHISIADIAGYSYIAHAPEGGVSLKAYANVTRWLKRIEALSDFVPMAKTPVSLAS